MSETDRRPAPTLWMFLLVLLGLYTIPRGALNVPASSKPESKRSDSGQAPESSRARNAGESGSVDRLLLDYFSLGRRGEVSGSPDAPSGPRTIDLVLGKCFPYFSLGRRGEVSGSRDAPSGPRTIDQVLGKCFPLETVPPPPIRCLIATLADPVRTTSGYHFDEGLTAILRGIEARQYVLDRYRLPWQQDAAATQAEGSAGHLAPRSPAGRGCSSAATRATTRRTSRGRPPRPPRCCWSSSCPSRRPRASTRACWPRASTGPRRSTITDEPSTRSRPQPRACSTSWARPSPAPRRPSNMRSGSGSLKGRRAPRRPISRWCPARRPGSTASP